MNTLMLVVLAIVLLCYCGGKYCPKVLSSNKEMLLGVLVGIALCSFAGLKMEGFMVTPECCRMGNFNGNVIEWDNGSPGTCDPGDMKSPNYEPSTEKWGERCSNMRTFSSEDGPVRANLSVGGSCSNDNECRRGLTCVDGRCGDDTIDSSVCDDDSDKLDMCRGLINMGMTPVQLNTMCGDCEGKYESGGGG